MSAGNKRFYAITTRIVFLVALGPFCHKTHHLDYCTTKSPKSQTSVFYDLLTRKVATKAFRISAIATLRITIEQHGVQLYAWQRIVLTMDRTNCLFFFIFYRDYALFFKFYRIENKYQWRGHFRRRPPPPFAVIQSEKLFRARQLISYHIYR